MNWKQKCYYISTQSEINSEHANTVIKQVEKLDPLYTTDMYNGLSLETQFESFFKVIIYLSYDLVILLVGIDSFQNKGVCLLKNPPQNENVCLLNIQNNLTCKNQK